MKKGSLHGIVGIARTFSRIDRSANPVAAAAPLAIPLRLGNAGSNTAADHKTVLRLRRARPRAVATGRDHEHLDTSRSRRRRGRPNWRIVRKAHDLVVLVFANRDETNALREKSADALAPLGAYGASKGPVAIESLAGRHERGILCHEEFAAKRAERLSRL